jgi:AraC-like DNA-binding protein
MIITPPSGFSAHLRTDDLPAEDRVSVVRDVLLAKPVAFDMAPLHDDSFFADMYVRELHGTEITMGHIRAKAHRSKSIVRDGNDDLLFSICLSGQFEVQQRNNQTSVAEGTACVGWCAEPITFNTDVVRGISMRVPRNVIATLVPTIDDLMGQQLYQSPDVLRLIDAYARCFESDAFCETTDLGRVAVGHLHDLISLAIGTGRDATHLIRQRSVRSVRTAVLKRDIVQFLGLRELNAEFLAKRHGISPRYVRKLFEEDGTTFSAFLLDERLRLARKLLISPLHPLRTISAIAYEAGFGDISYFNRCFRARFGMTPTDFREGGR